MAITQTDQYTLYSDVHDTFPVSSALTGTITKANNGELIIGSGTAFGTELQIGEWLFIAAIDEVRQIRSIASDTELYLYRAFDGAVSGATARRTPRQTYMSISWKVTDTTDAAKINGISQAAGTSATLEFDQVGRIRPKPITIKTNDTPASIVEVQHQY